MRARKRIPVEGHRGDDGTVHAQRGDAANLRSQLSGAIATAIVRPLIQVLSAEDAAFFFYEMSDEDVQTIRQAAESAVEIE